MRGNGGFLGAPWHCQFLMAVPPSVISENARACSCAAKVFLDLICQKNKDAISLEKQLVVDSKLIPLEKWQIVWELCGEGWFDGIDLTRHLWFAVCGIKCRGWLANAIVSQTAGRRLVTIYLCAVEIGPFFALGLCVSDCTGHEE